MELEIQQNETGRTWRKESEEDYCWVSVTQNVDYANNCVLKEPKIIVQADDVILNVQSAQELVHAILEAVSVYTEWKMCEGEKLGPA